MTYCGVVIPVHAETDLRVEQLHKCLRFLQNQTEYVAVIVDDDSTKDLCLEEIHNPQIRSFKRAKKQNELKTASCALNAGFEALINRNVLTSLESIDSVCYLHSDDLLPLRSINERRGALNPTLPFSYSRFMIIDEHDQPISLLGKKPNRISTFNAFPHHSSMWEINFFKELKNYIQNNYYQSGIFDETIFCGEDRDVSISTFELLKNKNLGAQFLKNPLYFYRRQTDSITGKNKVEDLSQHSRYVDTKHGFSKLNLVYNHLTKDMPWSFGFYLPDQIKAVIRPVRDKIKSL